MIKLIQIPKEMQYDFTHIARIFFDEVQNTIQIDNEGYELYYSSVDNETKVSLFFDGEMMNESVSENEKMSVKKSLYDLLSTVKKSKSQYGILVGVRPVKVVHKLLDENKSVLEAKEIMMEKFRVDPIKADLLIDVAITERKLIFKDYDAISLYIGIPFCPSICTYCSFPSNDINKKSNLVDPYMEMLLEEIKTTFKLLNMTNKKVDNIYIGGGTPTSISAQQLETLLKTLDDYVDIEMVGEYTVEAGRPDTITDEKLKIMKNYGVNRICINPQSMNNEVLKVIGRNHTKEDIFSAYKMIEHYNFNAINMDLIVGLPEDTIESLKETVKEVLILQPDNITVHTLAIKKASHIKNNPEQYHLLNSQKISEMLKYIEISMKENGYKPYYLYRQKNILGNFENVGYALDGKESIYNMRIIEEKHNILALGVGGVSKKIVGENHFNRIPNFRSVEDYIHRFDEMISRKRTFLNLTE
ncbi:MAG: coproporphyrinogen dehydrogenase HemZ [Clostridiales bacterium]|nr:coproporphyrinogen dehydrogenase HemZ [Clostridiales bacterium]